MEHSLMSEISPISFRHSKAEVGNNLHVHYVIGGSGDPIVLLHGFPETSHQWRKVMPMLANHFTVLAPDQRGSGFSDKPPNGYDAWTMAADIDALTTQLGLKRYFIVGHDMGAPVALCHAARYAAKVRGLVYLDEPLPGFNVERMARFADDNPSLLWWYPFHMAPNLAELLIAGKEREYLDYFLDQHTHLMNPDAIDDASRAIYAAHLAGAGGVRGAIGWYRAVFETAKQIRRISEDKLSLPVLGINGEYGVPDVGQQMAAVAMNVTSAVVKDSGHFVAEERPVELVEQLLAFVDANRD
jgi:pimeloyl-ACP methyl ester carboxylesterase